MKFYPLSTSSFVENTVPQKRRYPWHLLAALSFRNWVTQPHTSWAMSPPPPPPPPPLITLAGWAVTYPGEPDCSATATPRQLGSTHRRTTFACLITESRRVSMAVADTTTNLRRQRRFVKFVFSWSRSKLRHSRALPLSGSSMESVFESARQAPRVIPWRIFAACTVRANGSSLSSLIHFQLQKF